MSCGRYFPRYVPTPPEVTNPTCASHPVSPFFALLGENIGFKINFKTLSRSIITVFISSSIIIKLLYLCPVCPLLPCHTLAPTHHLCWSLTTQFISHTPLRLVNERIARPVLAICPARRPPRTAGNKQESRGWTGQGGGGGGGTTATAGQCFFVSSMAMTTAAAHSANCARKGTRPSPSTAPGSSDSTPRQTRTCSINTSP